MYMDEQENDARKLKFDMKKEKYIKKEPVPFLLYEQAMNCYLWLNMFWFLHIYSAEELGVFYQSHYQGF